MFLNCSGDRVSEGTRSDRNLAVNVSLRMKHRTSQKTDKKIHHEKKTAIVFSIDERSIRGYRRLGYLAVTVFYMSIGKRERSENSGDRVRQNTPDDLNREVDRQIAVRVRELALSGDRSAISERIDELDREWDIERALQANAAALGLGGLILGAAANKKWLALPGVVLPFLLQHAVQGWCPPVPLFRRLGYRTRQEIDREKYALKDLRGDFESNRELRGDVAALRSVDLGQ